MSASDIVTLEWLGQHVRAIQAEQRNQSTRIDLLATQLHELNGKVVTHAQLLEVMNMLLRRIGESEALLQQRFDALERRLP